MFSLRQLKAFVTVAENKSFTKAAKLLYMTQPAVSAQIKVLEERLGVQLLERNDKNIMLTEAGRMFYEEAYKIISLHDGFIEVINELKGVRRGRLCLAASTIPGEYILPRLIGDFSKQYPGLELTLKIADTGMVVDLLLKRVADLGMIGAPVKDDALQLEEFITDELIVISAIDAIIPNELDAEEFVDADFVLREQESGTRMVLFSKLKDCGLDPKKLHVVMELGSTRAIITAVENGLGLGVVSRIAASDAIQLGKLREIKVKGLNLQRSLYLAWNKNKYQSFGIKAFLNHIDTFKNC